MEHLRNLYQKQLNDVLLDGFERNLLDAAFINLLTENPLRLNNFAYALRELTRHLLHRLAPEGELRSCSWFKPDVSSKNGITRAHRIKFAIQGGLSDFYVTKKLQIDEVDNISKELVTIINGLSNYTHIEEKTFNSCPHDVESMAERCLAVTQQFVNKINELRTVVAEKLFNDVDQALITRINSDSVVELMEISTHQYVEEIIPETIYVSKIGANYLKIKVKGTIEALLMYGSASDRRRGDGAEIPVSFPVESEMNIQFTPPLGRYIDLDSFHVDISSWYE
ncbi:hypothetical protein NMR30_003585 [Vibrio cholerae]|nr:hypothetical protein [Vibrio cholerae]